jgi:hypothetical protein
VHEVPNPAQPYDENDPIVKAARWMFVSDDELDTAHPAPVESVRIESATRAPGEMRRNRRG